MDALRKIIAGAILGGGGYGLEKIGSLIFSATGGATDGPVVNYQALIELSSTALIVVGALVAVYGLIEGMYRVWKSRKKGEQDSEPTNSRPRNALASQQDRPRSPPRS